MADEDGREAVAVLSDGRAVAVTQTVGAPLSAEDEALSRTVVITTGKGGAMKTSLTANAAALAAANGNKVCIIDLDPQGDVADDLGYFDHPDLDDGAMLAAACTTGTPLKALIKGVRKDEKLGGCLDVVPGGILLADAGVAIALRQARGGGGIDLLAKALAPLAQQYDLVFIDTPPTDLTLQLIAIRAARWVLSPTPPDKTSIRHLLAVADQMAVARESGHTVDLLGVVLTRMPAAATTVRAKAEADIKEILGEVAPLFDGFIRDVIKVATDAREVGMAAHELAEKKIGADAFWDLVRTRANGSNNAAAAGAEDQAGEARDDDEPRTKSTGSTRTPSAASLAMDYVFVVDRIFKRIEELEGLAELPAAEAQGVQ